MDFSALFCGYFFIWGWVITLSECKKEIVIKIVICLDK